MRKRHYRRCAAALAVLIAAATPAAAEMGVKIGVPHEESFPWTFSGPLGRFDQAQLRRGFQVFAENCNSCHSLQYVAYRDLAALGIGFGPEDIKALAAGYTVQDGPDENGKMFNRPGRPADSFAMPYPNKEAARAGNRGMFPPDLSLITRARRGGPDFLHAFLTGYTEPPPGFTVTPGMTFNAAVSGQQTGMRPSLSDDLVIYEDGTPATVEQMSKDVTAFLVWASEPHMQTRKDLGFRVVIFLILLTIVFIALKREVWARLHQPPRPPRDNSAGRTSGRRRA